MQYNTVVSATMKMMNAIDDFTPTDDIGRVALDECVSLLLRVLYPLAPHITTALWSELGYAKLYGTELIDAPWPEIDESALVADELKLVVQVNGKLRGQILVPASASREEIEKTAVSAPEVAKFIGEATVRKIIVVPGKLVNIVAK